MAISARFRALTLPVLHLRTLLKPPEDLLRGVLRAKRKKRKAEERKEKSEEAGFFALLSYSALSTQHSALIQRSALSHLFILLLKPFQFHIQGLHPQTQQCGGLGLIIVRLPERGLDEVAFEIVHHL